MDLPMLDEAEYKECFADEGPFAHTIEGRAGNPTLAKQQWHSRVLERYEKITGFKETNINAVYHHRVSLYGPPCLQCDKPLRTPQARYCAACGFRAV
jgi:hypothetical protein